MAAAGLHRWEHRVSWGRGQPPSSLSPWQTVSFLGPISASLSAQTDVRRLALHVPLQVSAVGLPLLPSLHTELIGVLCGS